MISDNNTDSKQGEALRAIASIEHFARALLNQADPTTTATGTRMIADAILTSVAVLRSRASVAAEELKSLGLLWNAEAAVELGGEPFDENEQIERVAAIITRNLGTPSSEIPVGGDDEGFEFDQRCYYCRNKCCHGIAAHVAAIAENHDAAVLGSEK